MQYFILFTYLIATILAMPVSKRVYRPTSPTFSLIAHHKGAVFQYNLVKYDGQQLLLAADDKAFFGTIKANGGYTLNIPNPNVSESLTAPASTSVRVNEKLQLVSTESPVNASSHFGISESLLTYHNSSKFVACPKIGYRGEYGVYFLGDTTNTTQVCPGNANGYDITLMVQIDATVDFNEETNVNNSTISEKVKRFFTLNN